LLARALGPARYGSPDSATYLSAAEHLANGDGYVTSTLDEQGKFAALSCFAPLFSVLVAAHATLLGVTVLSALPHILVASFMLYALACHALLKVLVPSSARRWALPLALCLIVTPGSVTCLRGALSDLLGAALAMFACARALALVSARGEHHTGSGAGSAGCGALFALAIWARWSNLYLALGACLGMLLCLHELPLRQRMTRALTFLACVLALVGPLWLRNLLETGSPMGPRPPLASDPLLHVQRALVGIARPLLETWTTLSELPGLSALFLAVLLMVCAGIVARWLLQRDARSDFGLLLALSYALLLVLSSSSTRFDPLDHPRFWLPFLPLLLGLSIRALLVTPRVVSSFWSRADPRASTWLAAAWLLVLALLSLRSGLALAREVGHVPPKSGVFARRFASSKAVHAALDLVDGGLCTLAAPHAFWLFPQIGTRPISWLTATRGVSPAGSTPTCLLLLQEHVEYNTDQELFKAELQTLQRASRARLLQRDALAELWIALPTARASTRPTQLP
jgi:4-amino-4-deoxy-L-arabinose transferase-like glycosyltransferase